MLDRLRERSEAFLEGVARDRCRFALEDRPMGRIGGRYAAALDLFGQDRIREVQRALSGASGGEEKRLRFLLEFLAAGHARCVAAGELDRALTWEAHAALAVRDLSFPLRAARAQLQRAGDRGLRAEIEEARLAAVDEQLPVLEGLLAHRRDAVLELGYGTFVESIEVLSGIDLRGLGREGERFLADTEVLHRELLAWYLPRLAGVEPDEASESDAARLEIAFPYLEYFPDARALPRIRRAIEEVGIDPDAEGRLRTSRRPHLPSGAGAVCCAILVPQEVHLTVSDAPGRPAQASLLRELGHALHRANTAADLPVELRRLGDEAVPLAFGAAFEGLLSTPSFLERVYSLPRAAHADFLRLGVLLDLLRIRRDVGLLLAELELFSEPDPHQFEPRCAEILRSATGLRHDPRGALWALRSPFSSARTLRAEALGSSLSGHLRDRFDEDWWRNPRSGPLLLDLYRAGQTFTASELSVQLVSAPLSLQRVRERLEERA